MIELLDEMSRRFEELSDLLSDPEVIAHDKAYPSYVRERGTLARKVETYRRLLECRSRIAEAAAIIAEPDEDEIRQMAAEELAEQKKIETVIIEELQDMLLLEDTDDPRNVIVEIRAGTGGDEAGLFAADLFRMYGRLAERKGWKVEVIASSETDLKGLKEISFSVSGTEVYRYLRYESGVHRVQRVPRTEAQGRIHTSTATVAVLPEADEVEVDINESDLKIDFFRASGPGGQHVNKTSSSVRITHLPTNTVVVCQDERSQHKNKARAMRILRSRIWEAQRARAAAERDADRRQQIGSGNRNEKIRTYNFPQNRITDHRYNVTIYNLDAIMLGELDDLIGRIRQADRRLRLEAFG